MSANSNATIPFLDLKAEYQSQRAEVLAAIEQVLDSMQLHNGPQTRALEEEFAAYCGARYAVAVGSGTDALLLTYAALDLGPGDEVIVPSHTFIATVAPLAFLGATPVFVDIDPLLFTMDPERVQAAVTARTKAIVPVHLYGQPADMAGIQEIALRHSLAVVEDACQAVGASYQGQSVGSLGDAAAFSFVFTKSLKGYGDGGIMTTNRDDLAEQVRRLRDHGRAGKYEHPMFGLNCRMDEMQAAIVRVALRRIEERTERRRQIARRYTEALQGTELLPPAEREAVRHVYHLYVVRSRWREELAAHLNEAGIATGIHYPIPCHLQEACRTAGYGPVSLPETEQAVREILSLPVYPELTDEQVDRIVGAVVEFDGATPKARGVA